MSIFDRFPLDSGVGVTLDKYPDSPAPLMSRGVALAIIPAEERYGPGCMRPEYIEQAKTVLGHTSPTNSNSGADRHQ